jgi:hypothetical protein
MTDDAAALEAAADSLNKLISSAYVGGDVIDALYLAVRVLRRQARFARMKESRPQDRVMVQQVSAEQAVLTALNEKANPLGYSVQHDDIGYVLTDSTQDMVMRVANPWFIEFWLDGNAEGVHSLD